MYVLNAYGQKIKCQEKPIKGKDFIIVSGAFISDDKHDSKMESMEFSKINDFSGFTLKDAEGNLVDFATPLPTGEDRLQAVESAMLTMLSGGM